MSDFHKSCNARVARKVEEAQQDPLSVCELYKEIGFAMLMEHISDDKDNFMKMKEMGDALTKKALGFEPYIRWENSVNILTY